MKPFGIYEMRQNFQHAHRCLPLLGMNAQNPQSNQSYAANLLEIHGLTLPNIDSSDNIQSRAKFSPARNKVKFDFNIEQD